jgi:hypothetical protein
LDGDTVPQQGLDWRVFHEGVYAKLMEEHWHVDTLRKQLTAKVQSLDAALVSASADQARLRALTQENALLRQHIGTIGAENARLAVLLHDATTPTTTPTPTPTMHRQYNHHHNYCAGEPAETPLFWCLPIDGVDS